VKRLAETHSVLLLFLLYADENALGRDENIGGRIKLVRIDDESCAFFVLTKTQHLAVSF
jgi:hypothetical protein